MTYLHEKPECQGCSVPAAPAQQHAAHTHVPILASPVSYCMKKEKKKTKPHTHHTLGESECNFLEKPNFPPGKLHLFSNMQL